MEASMEAIEVSMEASGASTKASTETLFMLAFTCFHESAGSFHGSFYGRFDASSVGVSMEVTSIEASVEASTSMEAFGTSMGARGSQHGSSFTGSAGSFHGICCSNFHYLRGNRSRPTLRESFYSSSVHGSFRRSSGHRSTRNFRASFHCFHPSLLCRNISYSMEATVSCELSPPSFHGSVRGSVRGSYVLVSFRGVHVVQTSTTSAGKGPVQPSAEASMVAASTEASVEVVAIVAPSTETSVEASTYSTEAAGTLALLHGSYGRV